eukprot:jgi/Phyca11/121583/e_gw1.44.112.1
MHLEQDIAWLKDQVPQLERQHEALLSVIPTTSNVWCVAVEYFRLFRHGYRAPLNFLQAAMASDVTDGWVYGPEAIQEQWRRYSTVTVTEEMLHQAFPHLLTGVGTTNLVVNIS